MSNRILFIYEGEVTEKQLLDNIKPLYFDTDDFIFYPYKINIYPLWKKLQENSDYDIFLYLKTKDPVFFKDLKRKHISEIYLLFDYDGHDPYASDDDLEQMMT